jgi:putative sigma-54 modulation protein
MKITTTARHCELVPEDRQFVQQRLERLLRYFRDPRDLMEAHVVVGVEKYRHSAEITLKLRRGEVVSREEANDSRAAIELASERLEQRILRLKERRLSRWDAPRRCAARGRRNDQRRRDARGVLRRASPRWPTAAGPTEPGSDTACKH